MCSRCPGRPLGDPLLGPGHPCLSERCGAALLSATQIESRCGGRLLSPLRACSCEVDNRGIGVWETPPLALLTEQVHRVAPDPRRLVHSRPAPSPLIYDIYNILKY
ncbi:hypothetical protein NDU88_004296 [Pleurodeles waltl]|uniref:Uncharacterized protein n=1 Tax=Pleurodeles waltl TaxID=8319 RepID=A0AAV7MT73_PLEWA|nr:hypothetical protein NDU88_004296 [Pleurodeles waltl]